MSKSYTPGLKVLNQTKIYKDRILPMKGEVHAEIGEEVSSIKKGDVFEFYDFENLF